MKDQLSKIKQLQTKLEEAKTSWYREKKDLYKRLHKQEAKDATMKKKTYESHGVLHKQQAGTESTYFIQSWALLPVSEDGH